ncbi:MAG: hypothetical protein WCL23_05000 [Candidatus Moraniibacteriota bacterium]
MDTAFKNGNSEEQTKILDEMQGILNRLNVVKVAEARGESAAVETVGSSVSEEPAGPTEEEHQLQRETDDKNRQLELDKAAKLTELIRSDKPLSGDDWLFTKEETLARDNKPASGEAVTVEALSEVAANAPYEKQQGTENGEENAGPEAAFVELNNSVVGTRDKAAKAELLGSLSQEEISAIAKNIAQKYDSSEIFSLLNNFKNKPEIIAQPEVLGKFTEMLSSGNLRLTDVDRIQDMEGTREIFDDPNVRRGVQNSMKLFFTFVPSDDFSHWVNTIDRVAKRMDMSNTELQEIAEQLKEKDDLEKFVNHFGIEVSFDPNKHNNFNQSYSTFPWPKE